MIKDFSCNKFLCSDRTTGTGQRCNTANRKQRVCASIIQFISRLKKQTGTGQTIGLFSCAHAYAKSKSLSVMSNLGIKAYCTIKVLLCR